MALSGQGVMDDAADQRQANAGPDTGDEVGEPFAGSEQEQVEAAQQQHQRQHQPGQTIHAGASAPVGAATSEPTESR